MAITGTEKMNIDSPGCRRPSLSAEVGPFFAWGFGFCFAWSSAGSKGCSSYCVPVASVRAVSRLQRFVFSQASRSSGRCLRNRSRNRCPAPRSIPTSPAVKFSSTQHSCTRRFTTHHVSATTSMLKPAAVHRFLFIVVPPMDSTSYQVVETRVYMPMAAARANIYMNDSSAPSRAITRFKATTPTMKKKATARRFWSKTSV